MRQNQSQRKNARQAANNAARGAKAAMGSANIQEQVTELRQTLEDEANDRRPRLWVLPEDTPGHDKQGVLKDAIQAACPGYRVQMGVDAADGGVDEENIHAALLGATTGGMEEEDGDAGEGYWRFCDGVDKRKFRGDSGGKVVLEQHTETGEYRTRPYAEVVDSDLREDER